MKKITISIVAMLLLLFAHPALAEETSQLVQYTIPWGTGQDTDGDGVIDTISTENGTTEINQSTNVVYDTWYDFGISGVIVASHLDMIGVLETALNHSVEPLQTCKVTSTASYLCDTAYQNVTSVLNVATFFVQIPSSSLMSGSQEFWYRSPLVWNDTDNDYTHHYLNIYDDDNNLVWASTASGDANQYKKDDGSAISGVGGRRIYYKPVMNFRPDIKYRFEEYVKTNGGVAINDVKLYVALGQDIGADGLTDTYVFSGSGYARKYEIECSWSIVFTQGIGIGGTETLLMSSDTYDSAAGGGADIAYGGARIPHIRTHPIQGTSTTEIKSLNITFPLRTTKPLMVEVWIKATGTDGIDTETATTCGGLLANVTGTINIRVNIAEPADEGLADTPNNYTIYFFILNFNESGDAMGYYMYPQLDAVHFAFTNATYAAEPKHFAVHCEVVERTDEDTFDLSTRILAFLVGLALIIVGIMLILLVIPALVGVSLIVSGAIVANLFVVGGLLIYESISPGTLQSIADGLARAVKSALNLIGTLWEVVMYVWEKIILPATTAIINAVAEIIWLVAFLIVLWVWTKFLDIMKWVTLGRPEKALGTIESTGQTVSSKTRRYVVRPSKKVWYRRKK